MVKLHYILVITDRGRPIIDTLIIPADYLYLIIQEFGRLREVIISSFPYYVSLSYYISKAIPYF